MALSAPIEINVSDPWFTAIRSRTKTVEGRLHKGKFAEMRPGTVLVISKSEGGNGQSGHSRSRKVVAVVTKVVVYKSFEDYLPHEGLCSTLPGMHTIADGVQVYRQFYSAAMEKQHGVAAVHLQVA